jgi:hypothetical protein
MSFKSGFEAGRAWADRQQSDREERSSSKGDRDPSSERELYIDSQLGVHTTRNEALDANALNESTKGLPDCQKGSDSDHLRDTENRK